MGKKVSKMIGSFSEKTGCVLQSGGDGVIEVKTPFCLAGGSPLRFCIEERDSGTLRMTDNGDVLFHLASRGIDTSGPSAWYKATQIVSTFGIQISYTGEIIGSGRAANLEDLAIRYLNALLAVAAFGCSQLGEIEQPAEECWQGENWLRGTPLEELQVAQSR